MYVYIYMYIYITCWICSISLPEWNTVYQNRSLRSRSCYNIADTHSPIILTPFNTTTSCHQWGWISFTCACLIWNCKAWSINSLAPEICGISFKGVFVKLISWINILVTFWEICLRRVPQNPTDDKSVLVQVRVWCCQAKDHCLSQCWPRFMSPYDIIKPQWLNSSNISKVQKSITLCYIYFISIISI